MTIFLLTVLLFLVGYNIYTTRRAFTVANSTADLLREIGETVTSSNEQITANTDTLTSATALLTKISTQVGNGETIDQASIDAAVTALQGVQDANEQVKAANVQVKTAIDAAIAGLPGAGDTGEGAES